MAATKIAASTGVSAARYGRSAALGKACPIASKHPEQFCDEQDRSRDHRPFDEDVVAPVFWERRIGLAHRATSQVVPSLESLMTTPMAASSSRIRSDSLKFFRARAAVRSEIKPSISFASIPLACCLRAFQSAALSDRKPRCRKEAANCPRSRSFPVAALFRKPCNEAIICGVLRSSDSASITASDGCSPLVSAATQYQSSSVFALSSSPFNVQSIGER